MGSFRLIEAECYIRNIADNGNPDQECHQAPVFFDFIFLFHAHAHWFVTEYGAVNLYGKSLQERARLIISVAHPDHQEELDKAAFERYGAHHTYIKATTQTK